jgi:hypothetical protein
LQVDGVVGASLDFRQKKATARAAEGGELPLDRQEVSGEDYLGSVEIGHKFPMKMMGNRIRKSYGSNSRSMMYVVICRRLGLQPGLDAAAKATVEINHPARF